MCCFSVFLYLHAPFLRARFEPDAFTTERFTFPGTHIAHILSLSRGTQISRAIVGRIAVYVVYGIGEPAIVHEVYYPMQPDRSPV